ncbi:hypothetical protein K438DRAFT_1818620 [Mycena galopus ATCC 62051]|nr:hypothetical protein K438DRAFT_1818620 [Mycena galopus ATCC 62051]
MPALFSVVVLLPGNTAASFGRLLRSMPELTPMGFGWLLRFVPGTRTCLYLSFSLPFFICGALPGEPRPSMVLLPGNHQCLPMNETHDATDATPMNAIADPLPTRLPHLDYCYRVYWAP